MTGRPPRRFRNLSRLLMRIPVPWIFALAYLCGLGIQVTAHPRLAASRVVIAMGAAALLFGTIVAGWSWLMFRRAGTTTVPGRTSSKLVRSGPYRFTRNPMYVGLVLVYLGEAGVLRQIGPMLFLPFVVLYLNHIVIPVEEAQLTEVFGQDYERYAERVHRWI